MTEDQIAAELASRLEEPAAEEPVIKEQSPEAPRDFVDKMMPEDYVTRGRLMDWFEIPMHERHSPEVDRYINDIYSWARDNAGTGEFHDLLRIINEQEQIMGSRAKPGRVAKLYKYIKISQLRRELANRERLLYG